jgi:hypothetical protein
LPDSHKVEKGHCSFLCRWSLNFAVITSGFSVLQREVTIAEITQVIIPGFYEAYPVEKIAARMGEQSTRYLFTYGDWELGVYRVEAETGRTCRFLAASARERLQRVVHPGGHEFAGPATHSFIEKMVSGTRTRRGE